RGRRRSADESPGAGDDRLDAGEELAHRGVPQPRLFLDRRPAARRREPALVRDGRERRGLRLGFRVERRGRDPQAHRRAPGAPRTGAARRSPRRRALPAGAARAVVAGRGAHALHESVAEPYSRGRMTMHRLLALLGAATIGFAAQAQTTARQDVTLRLDWIPSWDHAPFYHALERGFYRDAGLNVTIGQGKGSMLTAQVVASGSETFGFMDFSTM